MSWLTVTVPVDPGTGRPRGGGASGSVPWNLLGAVEWPVDEGVSVDPAAPVASVVDRQNGVSTRHEGRHRLCHVDRTRLAGERLADGSRTDTVEQLGAGAIGTGGGQ
jgi:hypothetical protein